MIEALRAELAGLSAQIERKKKIEAMLGSLRNKEEALARQVQSLGAALAQENADVERLEKTTVTSILYSMLGKIVERLSQEQQEAFAAKLKYDAAMRQLDDCKAREKELRGERDSLAGCEEQYGRTYARLLELLRSDPVHAERICALEQQRGAIARQLTELNEAIAAGNAASAQIAVVERSLGKAEGWGTWDLLGGGLLADMAKHSNLDDAQAAAEHLQVLLSRFHTELADVAVSPLIGSVNVDGFLRFADYFFDGLIADWSVLSRIHDSQESVLQVGRQVSNAMAKLSGLKAARVAEKDDVERQIKQMAMDT